MQQAKSYMRFVWMIVLTSCFFVLTSNAYAVEDPVKVLKSVADSMIAGLKENQATLKTKPQIVYQLAYRYVVPNADLTAMAKRVLPPATWKAATEAQRNQFEKEFTKTLIRTYASALSSYRDQSVRFYPVRGGYQGSESVVINSEILGSQSGPIHVSYRLLKAGNSWKLYDLSAEGVSMLESFRAQFADILSQGSMDKLLSRMAVHNHG